MRWSSNSNLTVQCVEFGTTGCAERLERVLALQRVFHDRECELAQLLRREVGAVVLFNDALYGFSCCCDHCVRGRQTNPVFQCVDLEHLDRIVEMMIEGIDRELRTFGDEPRVQGFTFADVCT